MLIYNTIERGIVMNINRINLREDNLENLYVGNKMVKLKYILATILVT